MFEIDSNPFFVEFAEPATWHRDSGDVSIEIIPDFNIVIEGDFAVGFDGIFDLKEPVYRDIKSSEKITHNNRVFTVVQKKPYSGGVFQVLVQS